MSEELDLSRVGELSLLWRQRAERAEAHCTALEIALKCSDNYLTLVAQDESGRKEEVISLIRKTLSGSKLGDLFQALLEEHKESSGWATKKWAEAEALRKECGI